MFESPEIEILVIKEIDRGYDGREVCSTSWSGCCYKE